MLTSLLRHWMRPSLPLQNQLPLCLPEWSELMAEQHASIWWQVKPYTITSTERVVALCQGIAYLENHQIPGAIVECGVRKGGSMMASALALLALESTQRQLYLYDTFNESYTLQDVKQALMQTRYPWEKILFVPGRVEETIPTQVPEKIALLRLDTDGYKSTYHELEHLYPCLSEGGILIVDDYGHWQGAKKAVDEFFREQGIEAELRTIDSSARLLLKRPQQALSLAA